MRAGAKRARVAPLAERPQFPYQHPPQEIREPLTRVPMQEKALQEREAKGEMGA